MGPGLRRFPAPGCGIQHPEPALAPGRRAAAGPEEGARRRSALYEGSPARPRSRLRWEPPGEVRGGEGKRRARGGLHGKCLQGIQPACFCRWVLNVFCPPGLQ